MRPSLSISDDTVTLILPAATPFPTVAGQWARLPNGALRARYTLSELRFALEVADAIPRRPPPLTETDRILRRYDGLGYPWLIRTIGVADDYTGTGTDNS